MDNLTHAGVGALCALGVVKLARYVGDNKRRVDHAANARASTVPKNIPNTTAKPLVNMAYPATWLVLVSGAIAGNFPDIDFVTYFVNPLYYDAYWHRGGTHSLLLAPLWSALLAVLLWLSLWQKQSFQLLWVLCLTGMVSHIVADLLTAWDIALWYPFSTRGHSLGIIFIINLVFLTAVYIALWSALSNRRVTLLISLTLICSWPLLAFAQQQRALTQANQINRIVHGNSQYTVPSPAFPSQSSIRAWAQPFSIFNWKLVRTSASGYDTAYLRVISHDGIDWPFKWMQQSSAVYQPRANARWKSFVTYQDEATRLTWEHPKMYAVRDFMTYPALLKTDADCTWFTDLLYTLPKMSPSFVYGLCETNQETYIKRKSPQAPWTTGSGEC